MKSNRLVHSTWIVLTYYLLSCSEGNFSGSSSANRNQALTSSPSTSEKTQTEDPEIKASKDESLASANDSAKNGRIQQRFEVNSSTRSQLVDVVFVVDTSASMIEEKTNLEKNMGQFLTTLEQEAPNANFLIFMIGEDFRFPSDEKKISIVPERVDSHNALMLLKDFFSDQIVLTKSPRQEAVKQMIVISDDNARDVTAGAFLAFMESSPMFAAGAAFNGFVGLSSSVENAQCRLADIGKDYQIIAADKKFGGLIQDLCEQDWSKLLKSLAKKIASESRSRFFKLDTPANTNRPIIIAVNGSKVGIETAQYDPLLQAVIFANGQEPPAGAIITVSYTASS